MDGDPVTGEPSDSDSKKTALSATTLAEIFTQLCPHYIALGMTYDEFWHKNTKVHKAYREAWKLRVHHRNWEMWWMGSYVYEALLDVAPVMRAALSKSKVEPGKYSTEPHPLTEQEAIEQEEARRISRLKQFMNTLNAESALQKATGGESVGNR